MRWVGSGSPGADEPEWALAGWAPAAPLLTALLAAQHGIAMEGHGCWGGPPWLLMLPLRPGFGCAEAQLSETAHPPRVPHWLQQTGQGMWARRAWLGVGLEDDVHAGATEAKGARMPTMPRGRAGGRSTTCSRLILQRWDLGVWVAEVQVGGPEPVPRGQQHLWVSSCCQQGGRPWAPCPAPAGRDGLQVHPLLRTLCQPRGPAHCKQPQTPSPLPLPRKLAPCSSAEVW